MENGKLFLALALGTIDREAEQRAALLRGNGKWKMENGKLFLALALGTIDREAEQRAALFGGNGGVRGLPRLVVYANKNAPRMAARGMVGVAEEYAR